MNEVLKVIKRRRSIRDFKTEQIKPEELDMILGAGTFAPSGHNTQPWYFTIIQDQDLIDRINEISRENMARSEVEWIKKLGSRSDYRVTYNAPTVVIVSGNISAISWKADCSAAIQNMLLAAESLNIGSVWLGLIRFWFQEPEEVERLGLPEDYEAYYGVSFGYKKQQGTVVGPERRKGVIHFLK